MTESKGLTGRAPINRRALGKALSRIADASVAEVLAALESTPDPTHDAWRCGITGPAGAGKSSLLGPFAGLRLARGGRVAIVAIDPTSPVSEGAILGDRIRIDPYGNHANLFVRSLASRHATDGLADNLADVLTLLAGSGFDDILVETVGAGQAQYEIRELVDTVVVVLMPGAGDSVQAIKAGMLESGDIYVVNKCDLAGASEMIGEIASVVARGPRADGWNVPVLGVSALRGDGIEALEDAAHAHRSWCAEHVDASETAQRRVRSHIRALIERRLVEVLDSDTGGRQARSVAREFERVASALAGQLSPDGG